MLGPCWQKLFALNCLAPDHSAICPATLSVVRNGGYLDTSMTRSPPAGRLSPISIVWSVLHLFKLYV